MPINQHMRLLMATIVLPRALVVIWLTVTLVPGGDDVLMLRSETPRIFFHIPFVTSLLCKDRKSLRVMGRHASTHGPLRALGIRPEAVSLQHLMITTETATNITDRKKEATMVEVNF